MSIYSVYFEIFGKKMRVNREADSAKEARQKVRDALIFRKVERQPEAPLESDDVGLNDLLNIFGMK
jgi:hypothetical protein